MWEQHVSRMENEGKCKWPKPKIVQMKRLTSESFHPHCTIIHHCSDETGCCDLDTQTCQPKYTETINLYFLVSEYSLMKMLIFDIFFSESL